MTVPKGTKDFDQNGRWHLALVRVNAERHVLGGHPWGTLVPNVAQESSSPHVGVRRLWDSRSQEGPGSSPLADLLSNERTKRGSEKGRGERGKGRGRNETSRATSFLCPRSN